jgi:subtilisin family serine protease
MSNRSTSGWIPPIAVCLATATIATYSDITQSQGRGNSRDRTIFVNGHEAVANEALIAFKHGLTVSDRAEIEHTLDADEDEHVGQGVRRIHSRRFGADVLLAYLRTHPSVASVEPNWIVHADTLPNEPNFGLLWALRNRGQTVNGRAGVSGADINAGSAWDITTGSRANVVAVVDTGVDYTHPDLAANIWSAPAAFAVTIGGVPINCAAGSHGFNAITKTCDPKDDNGHGTHVAGTIGAVGNNAVGVAGVNWKASVMPLKFLDASGSGTTADAINAFEFAIQAKAALASTNGANVRVLSNSWSGGGFSQSLLDEIKRTGTQNMLFVAAAGNGSTNTDYTATYPASYDVSNVLAVAATDSSDFLASFSNFGSSSVDLAAPGVDILSTSIGTGYEYMSGTSMATPHVSGAAALVLSKCPLDTAGVKANLLSNVDVLGSLSGWVRSNGRLNISRAVRACAPLASAPAATTIPAPPTGVAAVTGTNPGDILITWKASAGAEYYKVKRSMLSTGPYGTIDRATAASYVNRYLPSGNTYYYLVTAVNAAGQSADSNQTSAVAK